MTSQYNRLYILSYNFKTHDQLSSYESKLRFLSGIEATTTVGLPQRQIFTLAYMKSHNLNIIKEEADTVDFSCAVVILLPINEENQDFTKNNYGLIEKNILIEMNFHGMYIF